MVKSGMLVKHPIVFVDFDGVIHPEGCTQRLHAMHASVLAQTIERCNAKVVVSSTWRRTRTVSALRRAVGERLGSLIIGCTGEYSNLDTAALPEKLHTFHRHMECVAWMRKHHESPECWLALDDRPFLFYPFCPQVVACNPRTGLDDSVLVQLEQKLTQLVNPA